MSDPETLQEALDVIGEMDKEMSAVDNYLKPNWSNDMPWSDEIIIAVGHIEQDRDYYKHLYEEASNLLSIARAEARESDRY